ncbi:serine/threonine-protein kinase [Polyangium sp. 6x1]|uniref:serine/threonine-protein kinase n=1 Tax=Polyangium sp. 6x1 TaxID=3042689 RepID=UPI002482C333|nr:serine/threonine-protein kinase [Polyangium sp. 6x1]MDI1448656.1 protein kinase [Polyangium sp. 6x1]
MSADDDEPLEHATRRPAGEGSHEGATLAPAAERSTLEEESSVGSFLRGVAFSPRIEPRAVERDREGETIGRFELGALLGRGGMGVVYAAYDRTLRRELALKLLRAEAVEDEGRRKRFLREGRAAAAVRHPNIAMVYEVGEAAGEVFLVMERAFGRSLRAVIDAAEGALPRAEAVRIAREIARGLAAAHEAGVIHRDIKPENVMIGAGGAVKILDFGLAKLLDPVGGPSGSASTDLETREGRVLGTPSYMSPEQARGLSADARSDVFSLGVVLYEMLAGERPFRGTTVADVLASILRDTPRPLLSRGMGIVTSNIVARCMAKDPAKRYPDAGALFEALEAAQREARRASRWSRVRFPLLVASVGVAIALALPFWRGLSKSEGPAPPLPASWWPPGVPYEAPAEPIPFSTNRPPPVAVTDLQLPPSNNPSAIEAYKVAMRSFRDADWNHAREALRTALEHDPNLAIAHLRLAMTIWAPDTTAPSPEALSAYREAMRQRDNLSPRDRVLLSALQPAFGADPPDISGAAARLADMARLYPRDAEVFFLLSVYRIFDTPERQIEAARGAIALDPNYADAWQLLGRALAETDADGAIAAMERCTSIAPTAVDCFRERAQVESALGRCESAEAHFRRAVNDEKAYHGTLRWRAAMLYALGKSSAAVAESLGTADEPTTAIEERAVVAAAYGDFDAAKRHAAEGLALVDKRPTLPDHARFALLAAEIELEVGREKEAAAIAQNFLDRRDGWRLGTPMDDPSVYMMRILARTGALPKGELGARVDRWYEQARGGSAIQKALVWSLAYGRGIEREEDALRALDTRPKDAVWPKISYWVDEDLGRAFWLAGKKDEALPYMERAFKRCDRFHHVLSALRADLLYGRALEARGDTAFACDVYGTILTRWGKAKPRSVTAEEARKRVRVLHCDTKRR